MKRLPLAALGALLLATGGCASMADVYDPAPQPSGYMSPAEGVPSATLVIVTPATLQGLQGRMIFNLPVDGQLTSVDYFLSRNPIRGSDRVAVPWRGVGDASYIRVHVHRPVYISARAVLSSYNCQNDVSFQPVADHSYRVVQVYSGMSCALEVVDLATNDRVPTVRTERTR